MQSLGSEGSEFWFGDRRKWMKDAVAEWDRLRFFVAREAKTRSSE
jgi:hypothetical protein